MKLLFIVVLSVLGTFVNAAEQQTYTLIIKVNGLRNSTGVVQFAIYNKDGTIPDKNYTKYFKKKIAKITECSASVTFKNLPKDNYAINILHDENRNGKIDKKFIKPIEGVGFSNYTSIGLTNRPNFQKASFDLKSDMIQKVKIIYL
jgi:uncharacterized protein (DUF2141 family)